MNVPKQARAGDYIFDIDCLREYLKTKENSSEILGALGINVIDLYDNDSFYLPLKLLTDCLISVKSFDDYCEYVIAEVYARDKQQMFGKSRLEKCYESDDLQRKIMSCECELRSTFFDFVQSAIREGKLYKVGKHECTSERSFAKVKRTIWFMNSMYSDERNLLKNHYHEVVMKADGYDTRGFIHANVAWSCASEERVGKERSEFLRNLAIKEMRRCDPANKCQEKFIR